MTRDEETPHEAFKRIWEDYPSQDNEGYLPDRGGFKCGFLSGARWQLDKDREAIRIMVKALEVYAKDGGMVFNAYFEGPGWNTTTAKAALAAVRALGIGEEK